jgi:hypothetical protein
MNELGSTSGAEEDGGDEKNGPQSGARLIELMERDRWTVPTTLRVPLLVRLEEIVSDPTSDRRDVLAAASAIIAASKLGLANIELTIKVKEVEELEIRMNELERQLDVREGGSKSSS